MANSDRSRLRDREIRTGMKINGNNEVSFKPWENAKTKATTVTAIIVSIAASYGVFAQVQSVIDSAKTIDSLEVELEILYATQDTLSMISYNKNKAQWRLLKAMARAVITDKDEADTLISDVEEEIKQDKDHLEGELVKKINRIKAKVKI